VLKAFPDLKPGDMVLMKKETLAVINYRFGRVEEVLHGKDRRVRSASIKYKNPYGKSFRSTVKPIQKSNLIVSAQ
jgi:hypothetical protein